MSVEKYWPGPASWDEISRAINALPADRFGHEEASIVQQVAGLLGVFGFPSGSRFQEEKQVSELENVRITFSSEGDLSQLRALERDTKFMGFAKSVFEETEPLFGDLIRQTSDGLTESANETKQLIRAQFARRVYDFTCHVVSETIGGSAESVVRAIRDLTELPKEQE